MKAAAIIVLVLCLAAVCGLGYLYLNARVEVSFDSCIVTDPVNQLEYFSRMQDDLSQNTFVGVRFLQEIPQAPEKFVYYTYTVHIRNDSMLPVEIMEMQVTPMSGDVLQIGDPDRYDLAAGKEADLSATILSPRDSHNIRELVFSYYIWGLPFFVRLTSGS